MTITSEIPTLPPNEFGGVRHALMITLDQVESAFYTGWRGKLEAVKQDRVAMRKLLEDANFIITALENETATRYAVREELLKQTRKRMSGDHVIVYFSGHGATLPDLNRDEQGLLPDGAWCLHDGMFVDDELTEAVAQFQDGVDVVLISDSCFFGTPDAEKFPARALETMTALVGELAEDPSNSKLAPVDIGQRVYEVQKKFYAPILERRRMKPNGEKQAGLLVMAACERDELARVDGDRSLFTGAIVDAWDRLGPRATYKELFEEASTNVRSKQKRQNPKKSLFGTKAQALYHHPAFGGAGSRPTDP